MLRASAVVPDEGGTHVQPAERTLVVDDEEVTTAELDARFHWRLSADRRDRIAEVRRANRAIAAHTRGETTIPTYYASVVESLLETVEALPDEGTRFVDSGIDPDALADETIAAAGKATYAIERAMETDANVELFAAWGRSPTDPSRWSGTADSGQWSETANPDRLFTALADGPEDLYARSRGRYEALSDRIERERVQVPNVGPVEAPLEWTWTLLGEGDRPLEVAVSAYAALVLFDAIETLLDHPSYRGRPPRRRG